MTNLQLKFFPLGEYGVNVIIHRDDGEPRGFPKVNYKISLPNGYEIYMTEVAPKFYLVNPSNFMNIELGLVGKKINENDTLTLRLSMRDCDFKVYHELGTDSDHHLRLFPNGSYEDLKKVE